MQVYNYIEQKLSSFSFLLTSNQESLYPKKIYLCSIAKCPKLDYQIFYFNKK